MELNNKPKILLVEDDINYQEIYIRCLGKHDYDIVSTQTINSALTLLTDHSFDVIIADLKMLGDSKGHFSGFAILDKVKKIDSDIQVIMITGYGTSDLAWQSMSNGAFDYITKGKDLRAKLPLIVQSALHFKKEIFDGRKQGDGISDSDRIIGNSLSMQKVFEAIYKASKKSENVLIYGEKGTGKRLVAQTIYLQSKKKNSFFKVIQCSKTSEFEIEQSLLDINNSFTNLTIYLADICELNIDSQKLLAKYFLDIGEGIQVISSTHQELNALVGTGDFLEELFNAINHTSLQIPPLRNRKDGDDILMLIAMFLQRHPNTSGLVFSPESLNLIEKYDYPGNVEELENMVEYVVRMRVGNLIKINHLPISLRNYKSKMSSRESSSENIDRLKLHQFITQSFNYEELRTLCFGLNLDFDNLEASGKDGKVRELITYFLRRQQLQDLIDICCDFRPNISWSSI